MHISVGTCLQAMTKHFKTLRFSVQEFMGYMEHISGKGQHETKADISVTPIHVQKEQKIPNGPFTIDSLTQYFFGQRHREQVWESQSLKQETRSRLHQVGPR